MSESDVDGNGGSDGRSVADRFEDWYHVPVLAAILGFMLWVRLQAWDRFTRGGEVFFAGNDAYYHLRQVSYTVRNWPFTMPYDVWTRFPSGTSVGQFGTLFDQSIATAALIVGLGSPSDHTIAMTTLVAPAVYGSAVAIPVYYIGKHFGSRRDGLFAAFVLALIPGTFLQRGRVGFADHNIAEVFFQAFAVFGLLVALRVAEQEKPVYEQVLDRDWDGLRRPLLYSGLAGVAVALYIWMWPPAVVLVGIFGLFLVVGLTVDYIRGRSPDHVAFAAVVSMSIASLLVLVRIEEFGFQTVTLSLLQFLLPLGVGIGAAFMAWLARQWNAREFSRSLYPPAVAGLIAVTAGIVYVVLPDLFSSVYNNVLRTVALGTSDTTRTVAEAQALPLDQFDQFMRQQYGMLFYTGLIGLAWMGVEYALDRTKENAGILFVVVWSAITVMMALTQVRFNYYLAAVVAVLNAWLFKRVLDVVGIDSFVDSLSEISGYQVLVLLSILIIVVAPLAPPLASTTVVEAGENNGPGESIIRWDQAADWMANNTAYPGTYANPDGERLEYYGTYEKTDDFEYSEGAYGVMSWWDYGHWITVEGERIPVANPFQQNPRPASAFLLSQNETRARLILEALPNLDETNEPFHELSNDDLRNLIDRQNSQQASEDTRYVVIDDQMAGEKFAPITVWTNPEMDYVDYLEQRRFSFGGEIGNATPYTRGEAYQQTMLSRLYHEDGNGLEHFRIVHEVDEYSYVGGYLSQRGARPLGAIRPSRFGDTRFGNWSNSLAQVSGQLQFASQLGRGVQLWRGVYVYGGSIESSVKTYEYVPGTTITGTVENPNATVRVNLDLEMKNTGRQFRYSQSVEPNPDGSFSVTVPYATTEFLGPEDGYTNSSVRAQGPYTVQTVVGRSVTSIANVSVPERAVLEEDSDPIDAPLEAVEGPTANISASATTITAGESIEFSSEDSSNVRNVLWSGAVSSRNRTVTKTFNESGNYTVKLTVAGQYGNRDTATINVTVESADGNALITSKGKSVDEFEGRDLLVDPGQSFAGARS